MLGDLAENHALHALALSGLLYVTGVVRRRNALLLGATSAIYMYTYGHALPS